jgi:TonB-dependent SusC/RagA subfamily outer membrane receptor
MEDKNHEINSASFHTLFDSYCADSVYNKKLPAGHYLKTCSQSNTQVTEYISVHNFEVFILNNHTDLCLQVYDLSGNQVKTADVKIKSKKMNFDETTQCFVDKKSNKKGLLSVTYNGNTAYYRLNRQYNNSIFKRNLQTVLYKTPIKYIAVPVRFVTKIPRDAVVSIKQRYAAGTIRMITNLFNKTWERVTCLFDEDARDDYMDRKADRFEKNHTGYLVFNKPKYFPNDTVKFKAFITKKNGKPIDAPVDVALSDSYKGRFLTTLKPYRNGAYEYQFVLHDSLNLKLGAYSYITLYKENSYDSYYDFEYISENFDYEDYELSKIKLDVRAPNEIHYNKIPFQIFLNATDENNLNLMDARVRISAKIINNNRFFSDYTFIPDTIIVDINKPLEQRGETKIEISDSLFPKLNFDYEITFTVLTSDNRYVTEEKRYKYVFQNNEFDISLLNDSIEFIYSENGIKKSKFTTITAVDNFENKTEIVSAQTPFKILMQPYFRSYIAKTDSLSQGIDIKAQQPLLQCFSRRTADSVFIDIQNPRNLQFTYNIYKKNTEKLKGAGTKLNYKEAENSKQNYFLSIRYLWSGKIEEQTYRISLSDRKLNIAVKQPPIAYPGQKINTEIFVSDVNGKPVSGVDLTAYSMTNKFDYEPPKIPQFNKRQGNKNVINNFHFNQNAYNFVDTLNYNHWKPLMQLDSIEYYKFLYPQNDIYKYTYTTDDSVTQFAPFVISKSGKIRTVYVVYVDNKPVYFNWTTFPQPYSFRINSGYHNIKLRLANQQITVDSIFFDKNKKTILSLCEDISGAKITKTNEKPELSLHEKNVLYPYFFFYKNNFDNNIAYMQSDDNIYLLNAIDNQPDNNYNNYKFNYDNRYKIGAPIYGNVKFNLYNNFSTNFTHEPFFEYEFTEGLLKMRLLDKTPYPANLPYFEDNFQFSILKEKVITTKTIEKLWDENIQNQRYTINRYYNDVKTEYNFGRLQIDLNFKRTQTPLQPLNFLLFCNDDSKFMRIYSGNTTVIHNLNEGYYKLISFFNNKKYHILDSIHVKANGLNYQKININNELQNDTFGNNIDSLLNAFALENKIINEDKELQAVQATYNMQYGGINYTGEGKTVSGYVFDRENKPISYASVGIVGTNYGTFTDNNGYYFIKVPFDKDVLAFSSIGYGITKINLLYNNSTNVCLIESSTMLQESVVIGYGTVKKSNLTASFTTLSGALYGLVAGVQVSENNLMIRGIGSVDAGTTPLYIIDGKVYTGEDLDLDKIQIADISVLKDEAASALYGSRAANGVVIITTKNGFNFNGIINANQKDTKNSEFDKTFLAESSRASSIRSNFSDYAYWQPRLKTDKFGKISFETTLPDDVTSWDTYVLAMNDNKQSGQTQGNIRAFKPFLAQLAVPRFLIEGDTTKIIGKTLNYTADSVEIKTTFDIDGKNVFSQQRTSSNAFLDTLQLIAPNDSVKVRYTMTKSDGYFDGEEREIPVLKQGLLQTTGEFILLDKDTTFTKTFDSNLGTVHLLAKADYLDVIKTEITRLANYKYQCNEQLASKLKALLAKKKIAEFQKTIWNDDKQVNKIIKTLVERKNKSKLWGWWQNSETQYNFSAHVLSALMQAKRQEFNIYTDISELEELMILYLNNANNKDRINILLMLKNVDSKIDNLSYIRYIEKDSTLNFNDFLKLMELKQLNNITVNVDTLKNFYHETIFGNVYYFNSKEKILQYDMENNKIQNTLLAYRILKRADYSKYEPIIKKMQSYFLETKSTTGWINTYETSNIIETVLADILVNKNNIKHSTLSISGDINQTIDVADKTKLEFETTFKPNKEITISKTGVEPIYFTVYQQIWNKQVSENEGSFVIQTHFQNNSNQLKAGELTKIIVNLQVKNDADYVMINVPVPAGCSYANKPQHFKNEIHREYYRNETVIFCNKLKEGVYEFEIELMPRFCGTYNVNPAKAELMYFPTFNANTEMKKVNIKD